MRLAFALLLGLVAGPAPAELTNRLDGHPSPYLAMHGQDPVHWQDWGPEVLRLAAAENKLVFISSGYFACHWCHVMQRESYRDPAIAELLNRLFIPVKLDRELHPALDAHLIAFVQRTQRHAGWPLNVFLTPEGNALVGLTYARPAKFLELLRQLAETWADERESLMDLARRGVQEMRVEATDSGGSPPDLPGLSTKLTAAALQLGDELQGGFGRQSRFPMIPQLLALLELLEIQPDARLQGLLQVTLDQMASQGLRDHLGGGFFRYTVDPGWQIPHYEKMLYTNAMIIRLYLRAARLLERPQYRAVARDTLEFTLRELSAADGGFIASLSAVDAQGVEGGAYLWSSDELERLLSADELAAARRRWRLQGTPPTEGGFLPVLDETEAGASPALLESARTKLMRARSRRSLPRDNKELAAWNGLMLSALADAAAAFGDQRYLAAGQALRGFLTRLWDGERLSRARSRGGPVGSAALEDYAYVARGLTDWARFSRARADLLLAGRLVQDAWKRFYVEYAWRDTDQLLLPGQARVTAQVDGPMPSPTAVLIGLSLELGAELPLPELATRAREALARSYNVSAGDPFWHAGHSILLLSTAQQR